MFTIGSFGIILNERNEVLLCYRNDIAKWNLPGGRVETHESPWAAVIREVREETGLNVRIERFLGVFAKPGKTDLVFSFLCRPVSGALTLNDEAQDLAYFSHDALPADILPKHKARIGHFFANPDATLLVEQFDDGTEVPSSCYFVFGQDFLS